MLGNAQGQMILAGDFTQVLDVILDRSKYSANDIVAIHMMIEDNGLIDV